MLNFMNLKLPIGIAYSKFADNYELHTSEKLYDQAVQFKTRLNKIVNIPCRRVTILNRLYNNGWLMPFILSIVAKLSELAKVYFTNNIFFTAYKSSIKLSWKSAWLNGKPKQIRPNIEDNQILWPDIVDRRY